LRSDALVAPLRVALCRYVRLLGADAVRAEDLVHEAFLVALRREDFDASVPAAAFGFLRTTARNLWLKERRRRVSLREVEDADRVWDAQCDDGGTAYVEALRRCVAALPERSRQLLQATYVDGEDRRAAAARFGVGAEGIKTALRRLRAALHDCIERRVRGDL